MRKRKCTVNCSGPLASVPQGLNDYRNLQLTKLTKSDSKDLLAQIVKLQSLSSLWLSESPESDPFIECDIGSLIVPRKLPSNRLKIGILLVIMLILQGRQMLSQTSH